MTYDPNRYILGTWGEFVEVERRPVVAPGTKALTKEQLAERRAARERAQLKPQVGGNPAQSAAQVGRLLGGGYQQVCDPCHTHPVSPGTVGHTHTVGARQVVATFEYTQPAHHQLLSEGWGWDQHTQFMTHRETGARMSRLELLQNDPSMVLTVARERVESAWAQKRLADQTTAAKSPRPRTAADVAAHPLVRAAKVSAQGFADYVTLTARVGQGLRTVALSADTLAATPQAFEARLATAVEEMRQAARKAEYEEWLAKMTSHQARVSEQVQYNGLNYTGWNPHPGAQQALLGTTSNVDPRTIQVMSLGCYATTNNLAPGQ